MRPILFSIGVLPFASWYVFFALAGVGAFLYAQSLLAFAARDARVAERAADHFATLFAFCYVAGWFGARAFSVWNERLDVASFGEALAALFSIGSMTFYGGALAATAVGVTYAAWKRLPLGLLFDSVLPAGVLALGLGRIGCHLNGDDFGRPLEQSLQANPPWWAVRFPNIADGLFRYPVQLEESLFSLVLAAAAFSLFRKARARGVTPGRIGAAVAALSAAHRFVNEFYRGDPRGAFFSSSLSISQGIAVLVFFVACVLLVWLSRIETASRIA